MSSQTRISRLDIVMVILIALLLVSLLSGPADAKAGQVANGHPQGQDAPSAVDIQQFQPFENQSGNVSGTESEGEDPQSDSYEAAYNQGVTHYRSGDYATARDLFTRSTGVEDRQLEAKSRFNLANCDYAEAVGLAEQDSQAAIEKLKTAISHYRGALDADSNDTDSRANAELAAMLIKKLQEQQEQEQQEQEQQEQEQQEQEQQDQQNQDEQNQDQQNGDEQNQDEQSQDEQSQDEQNQDEQSQDQQDQDQQNQDEQNQDEQNQDQQNGDEQNQDEQSQDEQNGDEQDQDQQNGDEQNQDEQDQDQQEHGQQGQDQQDQDQQNQDEQEHGQQGQEEKEQQQHDAPSSAQAGQPEDEQERHEGQAPHFGHQPQGEEEARPMTKEEAEKMLQAVRDRDLKRRYEKLRKTQRYYQPVDRDW